MSCREQIASEEYGDLLLDFNNTAEVAMEMEKYCLMPVDEQFSVIYQPWKQIFPLIGPLYVNHYLPRAFGLMAEDFDPISLIQAGILQTQRPPLSLSGKGVIIAFIDTGIRFADPEFVDAAGDSRIMALWDQNDNETGEPPQGFLYGTYYSGEQLTQALREQEPYSVVPSYDEIGHGTAMASVAAGSIVDGGKTFRGAAPEADIVVVKLRQIKQTLRQYYLLPDNVPAYSECDIMLGVKFAESFAETFRRPVVICLGVGTNMGNHTLGSYLAQYLNKLALIRNRGIITCAGNEGNTAHHYRGLIRTESPALSGGSYMDVEIRVGEGEKGFILELWGKIPDVFSASIRTPGGENIPRFRVGMGQSLTYSFVYEKTTVTIDSVLVEPASGEELIAFRIDAPTAGVWTIRVYASDNSGSGEFHMWLPITRFLSAETIFLRPEPFETVTDPGVAERTLTVTAYDDMTGSLYPASGRGFLTDGTIKPDLSAGGVGVSTSLGKETGTSIAAALTAGGVAQFFQWAVVERNAPLVENRALKSYFVRGALRNPDLTYPNRDWGYGKLSLQGTFDALAGI